MTAESGFLFIKKALPASAESSVLWLVLSLPDPGTWADSLPFSELEFPGLRVQQGPRISRSSVSQNLRIELSGQPRCSPPLPADANCTAQLLIHLRPQPGELSESSWQVEPLPLPALVQSLHLVVGSAGLRL